MRIESALAPSPFAFPEAREGPARSEREHAHEVHRPERGHGHGEGVGHGRERRGGELASLKRDLKELGKTAHEELRSLARRADLDAPTRRELRSLEKDFRHELKDALRDARHEGGPDAAAALSGRVEGAVDSLLSGVRSALGVSRAPADAPAGATLVAREITLSLSLSRSEAPPNGAVSEAGAGASASDGLAALAGDAATSSTDVSADSSIAADADTTLRHLVLRRMQLDVTVQGADGSVAHLSATTEQVLAIYQSLESAGVPGDAPAQPEPERLEAAA